MDTTYIKKKFKINFFINWIIYTLNLSLTFTSALSLFNSNKEIILNKHTKNDIIIDESDTKYMQISYLYPLSICLGFLIAFAKKKGLLIIACKIVFYIFLTITLTYATDMQFRSRDDLFASVLLCSTDLILVIMEFSKHEIKKRIKKRIKENINDRI